MATAKKSAATKPAAKKPAAKSAAASKSSAKSASAKKTPSSPVAKKAVGEYLYYYRQQRGLEYTVLAFANVYGPRQNPHGEAGVVAIFSKKLLDREQPVIFGDGLTSLDFATRLARTSATRRTPWVWDGDGLGRGCKDEDTDCCGATGLPDGADANTTCSKAR